MRKSILRSRGIFARSGLLAGCALMLLLAAAVRADDVTLIVSHASGQSWATASSWSNSLAAEAGHDYFAGSDRSGTAIAGKVVRTPTSDSSFPGDSLNICAGGTLALKCTGAGNTFTFGNLKVNGGAMSQYQDNSTATLVGNITFTGNSTISNNGANVRGITLNAALSGSGKLTMTIGSDDQITFNSDSNTYSGEYVQNGGPLMVRKAGALGLPTTYTLAQAGRLNIQAPTVLPATALQITSTAAVMLLGDNLSVQSLKVMGSMVKPGVYHASDMTTWPTQFSGAGTLAVGQTINPVRKAWLFN